VDPDGGRHLRVAVRRLLGASVAAVGVLFALVACAGGSEGTVVDKAHQGAYDYACGAGGTMAGPVAVPVWGSCSVPECWRLVVRDNAGDTAEPCVSREEYDRTRLGDFWHGRTGA
jgi:hypothetical protein